MALKLYSALIDYRFDLVGLSVHYRFDFIKAYHYFFMRARILNGQDDLQAWIFEDKACLKLLVRKTFFINNSKLY